MLLNLTIHLDCEPADGQLVILTDRSTYTVDSSARIAVPVITDYHGQDRIPLFRVEGFDPAKKQRIVIESIANHDVPLHNWHRVAVTELCQTGEFALNPALDRSAFEWFPYYHSTHKSDYVYENSSVRCVGHPGRYCDLPWCSEQSQINHWPNVDPEDLYPEHQSVDLACFGCSMTYGSSLSHGEEWPALARRDWQSVIKIAVPGIGVDGIYQNILKALMDFDIQKIVIVFPNLERRLLRWHTGEHWLRVPVSAVNLSQWARSRDHYNGLFLPQKGWLERQTVRLYRESVTGRSARFSERLIERTQRLLRDSSISAHYSSWDPDTYRVLERTCTSEELLPPFPLDRGAPDGHHTSAESHQAWYQSIRHSLQ
jgi:hypothetical protein